MSEIVVKLEVPAQMEPEFRSALKKVVERFASEVEYEAALGILKKSKLTPDQADKLARETKKGIARRHVAWEVEPPKKLVVDANIVFSAISTRTFTFELIRLLHEKGVRLCSPQYIHEELVDKTPRLLEYSKLTGDELGLLLKVLFSQIDTVPKDEYSKHMPEAERQIKDHLEDVPYLALAIKLDCPIWSNEQRLGKLKDIKAIPTHKLKKLFGVE